MGKKMDNHQHCVTSTSQRNVLEYDFFYQPKGCINKFSLPVVKNPCLEEILFPEIIDQLQENSLSFPDASSTEDHYKKRRKTGDDSLEGVPVYNNSRTIFRLFGVNMMIGDDSLEGVPVYNNSRTIRLFGVNMMIGSNGSKSTTGIDDDDEEKKNRSKGKGKEKIVNAGDQESEVGDGNSQVFFMAENLGASHRAKGIVINEGKNKTRTSSNKRKSKNPNVVQQEHVVNPPLFHPRILQEIQQPPVFMFEKKLEFSDVNKGLNRVFITRSEKLIGALTDEERRKVEFHKEDHVKVITTDPQERRRVDHKEDPLRVITTDPQGVEYTLHIRRWPGVGMIVLNHEWRKLVSANRLEKGDSVQGWGYRTTGEFRLALNIIRKPQHDDEEAAAAMG